MHEPTLLNGTLAAAALIPYFDENGAPVVITVIKQQFTVDILTGSTKQNLEAEINYVDVPWDEADAEKSSIRYPSDLSLAKPSTDVIVVGAALVPGPDPQPQIDVFVRVGPVQKSLIVTGPRIWQKSLMGATLSRPEPFERLDLRWEYAFGGSDFTEGQRPVEEPRNPVGCGLARDPDTLVNQFGPRIEDPRDLIRSHRSRPVPAGVAAIGRHWEPRRRYVGTIDDQWMEERMPLLPVDHDLRFNQVATPELITPQHLRGGETVQILNMNDEGPLEFNIPIIRFGVTSETRQHGEREHRPVLDTLVLEPNEKKFEMTWRSIVPLPRRANDIEAIRIFTKTVGGLPS